MTNKQSMVTEAFLKRYVYTCVLLSSLAFMISSCGIKEEKKAAQKEESIKQEYLQKGREIVSITQSELLRNVSHAIEEGGPGYAVDFCNIRAMVLIDSLSRLNKCQIRRIALKYRNPVGMPQTEKEKEQLYQYQDTYQEGESIKPTVYFFDDRIEYYQPIIIAMEACLKCHGDPGRQIEEKTLEKIKARYPNDLATGFALNDLRGAWKITFMK
ncbi:MAG: DUF3365 domain-containing protein [Bacteroidota bacterium]